MSRTIALSDEQFDELQRVLELESRRRLLEIHRTDRPEFRNALQRQYDVEQELLGLLTRAGEAVAST